MIATTHPVVLLLLPFMAAVIAVVWGMIAVRVKLRIEEITADIGKLIDRHNVRHVFPSVILPGLRRSFQPVQAQFVRRVVFLRL